MSISIEQLTAHALGEGTSAERAAIEAILASDPAARAEVDAIRQAAALLSDSLAVEASPGLDPVRRAALAALPLVDAEPPADAKPPRRIRFPHWVVWPGLIAASLAVVALRDTSGTPAAPADAIAMAEKKTRTDAPFTLSAPSIAPEKPQAAASPEPLLAARERQEQRRLQDADQLAPASPAAPAAVVAATQPAPQLLTMAPKPGAKAEHLGDASNGLRDLPQSETEIVTVEGASANAVIIAEQIETPRGKEVTAAPEAEDIRGLFMPRAASDKVKDATGTRTAESLKKGGVAQDTDVSEPAPGETYPRFAAEGWHRVTTAADDVNRLSTIGADVDSASYANVRRFLSNGQLPPADAVRTEELLNSFAYSYLPPVDRNVPFAVHPEVGAAPWAPEHRLVRIALKGYELDRAHRPPANLVFLVDVSGSMNEPTKLPLVQRALSLLTEQLRSDDHVAIVTYAGAAGVLLPSTTGEDKPRILAAIAGLSAGGSTNGAGGIRSAYEVAKQGFIRGGANRVVLCTDGDFNVGVSSREELERLITSEARSNVFLTALGFGMGNYHDTTMQVLADRGNGQYAYIDTEAEARKQLVDGCTGMLVTIAKDVKLQIEFNPAQVGAWRLLGYEKRHLEHADFLDDTKDGGEIGAGHSMTALYEIVPTNRPVPGVPALRYVEGGALAAAAPTPPAAKADRTSEISGELLTISLRWKLPEGATSTGIAVPVAARDSGEPSADFTFAAAVAEFGQALHGGTGEWSLERALKAAQESAGANPQRREFIDLVRKAQQLSR